MQEKALRLVSIVDDDESFREATARLLKTDGLRTECFSLAAEFLKSPHINGTGCLILDQWMPGIRGLELQQHLVNEHRWIPIIFITADSAPKVRASAMSAGAIDFLLKPCSGEALLKAVHNALQSRRNSP